MEPFRQKKVLLWHCEAPLFLRVPPGVNDSRHRNFKSGSVICYIPISLGLIKEHKQTRKV